MKSELPDSNQPSTDRKVGDRARILLLLGCLFLMPPLAGIFQLDLRIMGIPFTALYLFVVWGALIAGTAILSRRLQDSTEWQDKADASRDEREDSA